MIINKEKIPFGWVEQAVSALNAKDYVQILHHERLEIGALARKLSGIIHEMPFPEEQRGQKEEIQSLTTRLVEWSENQDRFRSDAAKRLYEKIVARNQVLQSLEEN